MKGIWFISCLLTASLFLPGALAHMAGVSSPPQVDLSPITLSDNGEEIEITLEGMAKYHAEQMGKQPQICGAIAATFRASSFAISGLWPDKIPERSDIMVKTHLLTPSSVQGFQFLLGIKNSTNPGILHVLLPDGSEVTNLSAKNLRKLSMNSSPSSFNFTFTRISTNESMTLKVRTDAFPDDFFELRKKVKFGVPEKCDTGRDGPVQDGMGTAEGFLHDGTGL